MLTQYFGLHLKQLTQRPLGPCPAFAKACKEIRGAFQGVEIDFGEWFEMLLEYSHGLVVSQ